MFDSHLRSTGTKFTTTIALLAVGLIVSPLVVLISRPVGMIAVSTGLASSVACLALAWLNWKRYSQLTIPSIEDLAPRGE
ncbi:MAG: hypothetical protein NTZ56_22550 [Acidobacteria bacterium]|nr:hypothetical protein [Acidobacteriota bacterium]